MESLEECYPDVFGSVCAALKRPGYVTKPGLFGEMLSLLARFCTENNLELRKNFFEKGEPVFQAGSYATSLQLTSTGAKEREQELAAIQVQVLCAQKRPGTYSYQDQNSFETATGQQVRVR